MAHECRQRLEHVARITKRCGQCLRGTDREAAGEDRESAENGLLRGAEECVTPPDHLAKGPVALGKITRVATAIPDGNFRECCEIHDAEYFRGGLDARTTAVR